MTMTTPRPAAHPTDYAPADPLADTTTFGGPGLANPERTRLAGPFEAHAIPNETDRGATSPLFHERTLFTS